MSENEKTEKLKNEFKEAAKNGKMSEELVKEKPQQKGKGPMIALALFLVCAVILVVVILGLKDKNKDGGDNATVTPTAGTETVDGDTASAASEKGEYLDYAKKKVTKIGDYKNFSYAPFSYELTDEYLENYYEGLIKSYSDMGACLYEENPNHEGTTVALGDIVNLDYTGYIEGVPFENGSAEGVDMVVGAGVFMEDLENGLIGQEMGSSFEIKVTFPNPYSANTALSGKEAVFSVKLNYFCKTVALTVDNAHIFFHAESKEKFISDLKTYLEENPAETEESYLSSKQSEYVQQIIEGSEFGDLTSDINDRYGKLRRMYIDTAEKQNTTFDALIYSMGFETEASFEQYYKAAAEIQARTEMLFHVIAADEELTISDDKYNEIAGEYAKNANYTSVPAYEAEYDKVYGKGALKIYVETIYYQTALFEKYAVKE